jgi:dihydroxyacetone kinase
MKTSEGKMDSITLARAVAAIRDTMAANKDYLTQLDQQNGDGDLGITMVQGFSAVALFLESNTEQDLGKVFMKCSTILNEAAPSTLGTITSFVLMGMAKVLRGKTEASLQDMIAAFEAGLSLMMEKAKSKPGDKTILDSLVPAAQALKLHASEGTRVALSEAALASAEGSESTRGMKSVHGRAAYYGDKSIGILDGGSVVGKLIFESLAALVSA